MHSGTADPTPSGQPVHVVLPAAGTTVRGAVRTPGQQLGPVAHRPGPLPEALAPDDRRTVSRVPEPDRAADPARLTSELPYRTVELPNARLVVEASTGGAAADAFTAVAGPVVLELDDPQCTDRARFTAWCAEAGANPDTGEMLELLAAVIGPPPAEGVAPVPWELASAAIGFQLPAGQRAFADRYGSVSHSDRAAEADADRSVPEKVSRPTADSHPRTENRCCST
ncbi:hypothetical protein [Kitasatospora sp. NPDC088134]|uniref:hypothetical protein n=1 Tax=Kitasatospora sp. NPDC088134 TaxID=3364071 RepID=UPI003817802F